MKGNNSVLIELHVPDFEKTKEFYGKLGFQVVREEKPEEKKGYLVLQKDNNILCFWPGNEYVWEHTYFKQFSKETKLGYGVEIVIMVEDIDDFYNEVKSFVNVVGDLKLQPWGVKDFRIEDPFGFYLRFTEPLDVFKSNQIK